MDQDKLYARALAIYDRKANGLYMPILQHLAMRRYPAAMALLANLEYGAPAHIANPFSAAGLLRRAWRLGDKVAAQNMAMTHFNNNEMAGFRLWARRAAKLGDECSAEYVKHFDTRLPHGDARKIGRHRPKTGRDEL
jgi:hypothetical protein